MFALGTGCFIAAFIIVVAWMYAVSRKGPEPIRELSYDRTDDRPRPTFSPQRFREVVTELVEPAQPTKRWFELPGVRKFTGERTLNDVPTVEPEAEGDWTKARQIVAVHQIEGEIPGKHISPLFVELTGSYALMGTGSKTSVLKGVELSSTDIAKLEEERREAVRPGDGSVASENARRNIDNFLGGNWQIKNACDPARSTIQCVAEGRGEPRSFATSLYDGSRKQYADLQCAEVGGKERVLIALFVEDGWSVWIGRRLKPEEAESIQPLE